MTMTNVCLTQAIMAMLDLYDCVFVFQHDNVSTIYSSHFFACFSVEVNVRNNFFEI